MQPLKFYPDTMEYLDLKNNACIALSAIPELDYATFRQQNITLLSDENNHCVALFGYLSGEFLRLICGIADDRTGTIHVSSSTIIPEGELPSLTAGCPALHVFERELHENFGVRYSDHPWLKPVRFPQNAFTGAKIPDYPFYRIDSEELHEVGVGPIHAGIIKPGHFRFICNGEQILHLEIQLGFQHRGIEKLFLEKENLLQRATLAENIAGDTVVGHTLAFVNLWESLCGFSTGRDLQFARTLALELERIAVHTGDLSALCTDIGYQLGSAVFGRLRTPIINFFQQWGGNRLAKGLIRTGKTNFPFIGEHARKLSAILDAYESDFLEMADKAFHLPTSLARFEKTGIVTQKQAAEIGAVGMAARASGLARDIRASHPYDLYVELGHRPVVKHHGDVYSRIQVRKEEIIQSLAYVRRLLQEIPEAKPVQGIEKPLPDALAISLTEGWRGEICHCAVTGESGQLIHYKVTDPSLHNWLALALAVRNNEISDFPICNKSFNLSYCGHDL
ncbi:MAG: NADH-quinone oxidoreductase subunit C [bacterium]